MVVQKNLTNQPTAKGNRYATTFPNKKVYEKKKLSAKEVVVSIVEEKNKEHGFAFAETILIKFNYRNIHPTIKTGRNFHYVTNVIIVLSRGMKTVNRSGNSLGWS